MSVQSRLEKKVIHSSQANFDLTIQQCQYDSIFKIIFNLNLNSKGLINYSKSRSNFNIAFQ